MLRRLLGTLSVPLVYLAMSLGAVLGMRPSDGHLNPWFYGFLYLVFLFVGVLVLFTVGTGVYMLYMWIRYGADQRPW